MASKYEYSTSMYIGSTSQGVAQPVFYDSHTPIFNNKPPGALITGSPGSGKTFLAMTLAAISAIIGKTTIILDPKGDFLSLAEIKDDIGDITFWDLSSRDKMGILDPFSLSDDKMEQLDLATTVIDMLVGGLSNEQVTELSPVIKDVCEMENPTLQQVVNDLLMEGDRPIARNLGVQLDLISKLKFAHLCFAPPKSKRKTLKLSGGTTVITLVGMELTPNDGNSSEGDRKQRLSTTVFYLITNFIRRTMEDESSDKPKTLIIDEAWAVLNTKPGADVVRAVALLGRSKNLALLLVSQNTSHMKHLDIDNTITTHFAFRTDHKEALQIVKDMRLPEGEGMENRLQNLDTGECLMKDFKDRYSTVQISNYKKDWELAFKTNPLDKQKARAAREEAKLKNAAKV